MSQTVYDAVAAIGLFVLALCVLVVLRLHNETAITILPSEAAIALIPVILWMFLTGKIGEFAVGNVKVKRAFERASRAPAENDVRTLPYQEMEAVTEKGPASQIPTLIENESPGVSHRLGQFYVGSVVEEYLRELTRYSFFRYWIINDSDGKFFALADARALFQAIQDPEYPLSGEDLAEWIGTSNLDKLKKLPGYQSRAQAISPNASKEEVLKKMEETRADHLPVVNSDEKLIGMLSQSDLTASLLLDINKQLQNEA